MNIAIIPARGGSKRIPKKNIKNFCGLPAIAYSIKAAKETNLFNHIIVSSDSEEIIEIAKKYGAEVAFQRPSELADDDCATVPVVAHTIQECIKSFGWKINSVCCIYPASPLICSSDISSAFKVLSTSTSRYVFPVARYESPIQRAFVIKDQNQLTSLYPENQQTKTQDLEVTYYDAGQFYWGHESLWLSKKSIHNNAASIVIPSYRAIDIDTPNEWMRAELIYKALSFEGARYE